MAPSAIASSRGREGITKRLSPVVRTPSRPHRDITRIEDVENGREVVSDPQALRKAYLEELAKFTTTIRAGCDAAQIDFVTARTDEPSDRFLGHYLARRQMTRA